MFAFYPTPRGVKRFQNRMRYFAMRINQGEEQQDWLAGLIDKWLTRGSEKKKEKTSGDKIVITEPQLWALGLVSEHDHKLLNDHFDKMIEKVHIEDLAGNKMAAEHSGEPGDISPENEQRLVRVASLTAVLPNLEEKFGDIWPGEKERQFFRELSQGIRD